MGRPIVIRRLTEADTEQDVGQGDPIATIDPLILRLQFRLDPLTVLIGIVDGEIGQVDNERSGPAVTIVTIAQRRVRRG